MKTRKRKRLEPLKVEQKQTHDYYLLREFRIWLIDEKLEQSKYAKQVRAQITNSTTSWWIKKLLHTPLEVQEICGMAHPIILHY